MSESEDLKRDEAIKADAVEAGNEEATKSDAAAESNGEAKTDRVLTSKRKRLGVTLACVVAVLVLAGVGAMVWREQPSFCNAICHDPMDPYLPTYEATPGESATDKWGNEVEDAGSMLAAVHGEVGKTRMDCHVPQLEEQVTEGLEWVTGNYDSPLLERTATQLVEARGLENTDELCMNSSCHPYTRDDLEKKTAWMGKINPHTPQHGEQECTTCHKAHRASVNYCTQCHTDAVVPDGWIDYTESKQLQEAAAATE